jgi:hypothetical protein
MRGAGVAWDGIRGFSDGVTRQEQNQGQNTDAPEMVQAT